MSYFTMCFYRIKYLIGWSSLFSFCFVSTAVTLEPPDCEKEIHGARINTQILTDNVDFVLNLNGHWEQAMPPVEIKLNDPDGNAITLADLKDIILPHRVYLYKGSAEIQEGSWSIHGLNENSKIFISPPPSTPLIEQEPVSWKIIDDRLIHESNSTLEQKAREALSLNIPIPSSWTDWNEHIHENILFYVLLAMDKVPDPQKAEIKDIYLALAMDGTIVLKDPYERCREQPYLDWYEGKNLHGLIWPFGFEPTDISLQFKLSLEEPRQSFLETYVKNFNEDQNEKGEENKDIKNNTNTGGCQVINIPDPGNISFTFLLGMVLSCVGVLLQKKCS